MATQALPRYTVEQYLEYDRNSDYRNDFISGEIVAMAGGTPRHSLIANNVSRVLGNHSMTYGCSTFNSDLRVCLDLRNTYVYPDATVVCGPLEYADERKETVANPGVVVEVLSYSTRDYDLGGKLRAYWKIPSLTDILLIDQDRVWIEYWYRSPGGAWSNRVYEDMQDALRLESLNCEIPVSEIYARVEFPDGV